MKIVNSFYLQTFQSSKVRSSFNELVELHFVHFREKNSRLGKHTEIVMAFDMFSKSNHNYNLITNSDTNAGLIFNYPPVEPSYQLNSAKHISSRTPILMRLAVGILISSGKFRICIRDLIQLFSMKINVWIS